MRLTFLGGAGTVTGSKFLVEAGGRRILVDCGLFQGLKDLRLRNWERLPVAATAIDAVVLTHAHLDHTGYLPLLIRQGFAGPVYSTASTKDLCDILLPDSGFLQEKDAEFANRHSYSRHKPALPLYTEDDARAALRRLQPLAFHKPHDIGGGASIVFRRAGHILGAASVALVAEGKRVVFSGDIGRYGDPMMPDPETVDAADYLLVESTYGDRLHAKTDPEVELARIVSRTVGRGGTVVIPAFAVGRAQHLMFHLERLKRAGELQNVPVFLDSPMAADASDVFCRNAEDHRLSATDCQRACALARYVRGTDESKALTQNPMPKVIISASGMATGGRVLHHLKRHAPDPRCTILFAGFQAAGTRGASMVAGAASVRIHGEDIPVAAEVQNLSMLSAHADQDELLRWLRQFKTPPRRTFITHGESHAAEALAARIAADLGWRCHVPQHLESLELS
ncbi:MAG: MBL fold metallo-hydrolase [Xanthobacteraceae bacterium]|nr:MBL fold metallo-hydrolase [Xanthobacteraceae bacterium]